MACESEGGYARGLDDYQHHFEVCSRYLTLKLYKEPGTPKYMVCSHPCCRQAALGTSSNCGPPRETNQYSIV